ncbi:MAG: DUF1302 domain-containing protein [Oceanospirillaceae bacterium]|nr:DUF1302 domain-containing protein [Oceanospirillaceae bacterium]MCP5349948.1 DUF1302 domain-containing protein [Oceanospirillaceae bacterium]
MIKTVFKKLPLAAFVAAAGSANALEFSMFGIDGQFDNTISYGAGWRAEDPDRGQVAKYGTDDFVSGGKASTYNYDDGTLNYEKGKQYTNVFKWSGDLSLTYDNYGAFARGRAYYDSTLMDHERPWKQLSDETKDAAGKGAELMDAFVYANYEFGDTPVSMRFGRQVLSWGESTFIQGGINSINPIDASAARKPGVEVKEVLLPVNMAYGSIGITDAVSLEAFYQIGWEATRSDPCGTFYSTVDFVADGCGPIILANPNPSSPLSEQEILAGRDAEIAAGIPLGKRSFPVAERNSDVKPESGNQFGLALRWYSEALGDTEFGLYHMNLHSRVPYIVGNVSNPYVAGTDVATNPDNTASAYPVYQIGYPEDIKLTGISFNRSTEGGWSIGGEVSVKQDMPISWNAFEILYASVLYPTSKLFQMRASEVLGHTLDVNDRDDVAAAKAALAGEYFEGFDRYDVWQAQMTFIKFVDQVMGASRLSLITEVGATYVPDLPGLDEARYGRSGAYGIGADDTQVASSFDTNGDPATYYSCETLNENPDYCTKEGFTTKLSGGIRLRATLDYNNALFGANLQPTLAIGYDRGNAPEPGGQFIDQRVQGSVGLNFEYLNTYSGGIAYTMYDGTEYDPLKDRDNYSLNLKVTF